VPSTHSPRQTPARRGITPADVDRDADSLLREGERQDLEVQAHILSIREQEMKDRLAAAWRRGAP
jgi:hypothetical protein